MREKVVTEIINRIHGFPKYYYGTKYETYYQVSEALHELWNRVKWKSRMKIYNEVYSHLAEKYRDEYTPYVLRSCHYFYEYIRSMEEVWIKLRGSYILAHQKEEGKLYQFDQFTMEGVS